MGSYWQGDTEYDCDTNEPVPPERSQVVLGWVRPASDGIPKAHEMYEVNGAIIRAQKKYYGSKQTARAFEGLPDVLRVVHGSLLKKLNRLRENDAMALNLREELVYYRAVLEDVQDSYGQALELHEAVSALPDATDEQKRATFTVLRLAGDEMASVIKDISSVVVDAARVEYMADDKFTGRSVRELMYGAVRMLYEVCGDEHLEIAEAFNRRITQHIPAGGDTAGTRITPDQVDADAMDMDATVPHKPTSAITTHVPKDGEVVIQVEPEPPQPNGKNGKHNGNGHGITLNGKH
jgi:hypothetical protein